MKTPKDLLLELRDVRLEDAGWMLAVENNPEFWIYGDTQTPYLIEDIELFIEESMHSDLMTQTQLRKIVCSDQLPIGMVDLFEIDHDHLRAGIGILIFDEAFRSKGVASWAITVLEMFANKSLGLRQLSCSVRAGNEVGRQLFTRLGYQLCGDRKDWYRLDADSFENELLFQKFLINQA